jgi:Zn ribbon nucleic-acid-binding protein
MANGVETLIQTDLQTILAAAGMAGMTAFDVLMAPSNTEQVDGLPRTLICPRNEETGGLGFEAGVGRKYVEEIIIIAGNNGDFATQQPQAQLWKEQAVNVIERVPPGFDSWRTTLPNCPTVYDIRIEKEIKGIDPTKLASNYVYQSFFVAVRSSE